MDSPHREAPPKTVSEIAKQSRLRKSMWITALQESAHALQQQVNMLGTALRTPAEPETATAFADLFGLDRLWPSYRAAASQTTDDRHYSAIRALSPADREALAQTNDAEVEFLQLIGAAPAAFLLVLRNRTVLYATQKLMIMTGLHIENIIGRNMDVLFAKTVSGEVVRAFENTFVECTDMRVAFPGVHAVKTTTLYDAHCHGLCARDTQPSMLLLIMNDKLPGSDTTEGVLCLNDSVPGRPLPGRPKCGPADNKLEQLRSAASRRPGLRPKRAHKPSGRGAAAMHAAVDISNESSEEDVTPPLEKPSRAGRKISKTTSELELMGAGVSSDSLPTPPLGVSYGAPIFIPDMSRSLSSQTPVVGRDGLYFQSPLLSLHQAPPTSLGQSARDYLQYGGASSVGGSKGFSVYYPQAGHRVGVVPASYGYGVGGPSSTLTSWQPLVSQGGPIVGGGAAGMYHGAIGGYGMPYQSCPGVGNAMLSPEGGASFGVSSSGMFGHDGLPEEPDEGGLHC